MLKVENISVKLGDFELKDVSFEIDKGDYFVVLGESGVGKSVLLEVLAGITPMSGGRITMLDKDISYADIQSRSLGLVYQDQALFPHLTVEKNIEYPLNHLNRKGRDIRVYELALQVGVEKLLKRYPETLSIGEAQRTALARSLALGPDILLLDEPLASLDIQAKRDIRALLRKLNASGQTIIHVTHDYEEAIALASKIAILENSTISQVGTPEEVFHQPRTSFVASFIGIKNFFKGNLEKQNDKLGIFKTDDLEFEIATDVDGGDGNLILKSENITISKNIPKSSARNHFKGIIVDIEPARLGIEVTVDIGTNIVVLITRESLEEMNLKTGMEVWINFKATSAKFLEVN